MGVITDTFEIRFLVVDILCASFAIDRLGGSYSSILGVATITAADFAVGLSLYRLAAHDVLTTAEPPNSPLLPGVIELSTDDLTESIYRPRPQQYGKFRQRRTISRLARLCGWMLLGSLAIFCSGYAVMSQAGIASNGTKPSLLDLLRNVKSIVYAAGSVDDVFRRAATLNALLLFGITALFVGLRLLAINFVNPQQHRNRRLSQANTASVVVWLVLALLFATHTQPNLAIRAVSALAQRPWRDTMSASPVKLSATSSNDDVLKPSDFFLPSIHGRSNIDNPPRWTTSLERKLYKHVFVIWLESADANMWPWKETYCAGHNCGDIKDEHNSAQHMTPFFANLTKQSLYIPNFITNSAYSVKSDHSSACGMHPPISDFNSIENDVADQRPCLAHILQSKSFSTSFFSAAEASLDHFHTILEKQGWQEIYGMERLLEDYPDTPLVEPRAEDRAILQPMSDWLDRQLAENKPTAMSWHTSTTHWPFMPVPGRELERYTWLAPGEVQNRHLNLVRYTDGVLQEFYEMLQKKDILDDSLIVVHGDHGPRVNKHGGFVAESTSHENLAVPAIISTPSTRARSRELPPLVVPQSELWTTTDVLPTLLDLMQFPTEMVREYPGQSMLRHINQRLVFSAQVPGATHLQADNGRFKAIRDTWNSPDYCGFDRLLDPLEELGWCTTTGWMERKDEDGLISTGEALFASPDDAAYFIEWIKWAGLQVKEHTAYTGWYWSNSTTNANFNIEFRQRWQI